MRTSSRGFRWAIPALLPLFAACALDWTEVEKEALVAASVTVVLTVDPADSTVQSTDILALLVRDSVDGRVPGASVRVTDQSDRTLTLEERFPASSRQHDYRFRDNLWDEPGPLYLTAAWMPAPSYQSEMGFPRKLIEVDVPFNARKAARRLETGLPWGVTVRLAVAAIDENWANWIRPGQINVDGEVPVPSVFGDGTGMFGTAVRWTATMESRDAEEDTGLVDCGLVSVIYN